MAWINLNYHKIGFGTYLLVFVFVLFCLFSFATPSTYAIDDFVYTVTSTRNKPLCDDSSTTLPHCSDYSFVKIENTGPSLPSVASGPVFNNALYTGLGLSSPMYLSISFSSLTMTGVQAMNNVSSFEFTFTLTDSISSTPPSGVLSIVENGSYDVINYAAVDVNVPQTISDTPYDEKLDRIIIAIYTCGAILLVIYFFYCIYGMIIKSTGGKR